MTDAPCVVVHRSAVVAGALWVVTVGLLVAGAVAAVLAGEPALALVAWGPVFSAVAAVASVRYLLVRSAAEIVDQAAMVAAAQRKHPPGEGDTGRPVSNIRSD